MRYLLLSALLSLALLSKAQTTHTVDISGMSFSPSNLTIFVGDSVVFTNASGISHNVNGTQATFPSNPASFGNSTGTAWVYGYKFTMGGTYNYRCDIHPVSMTGTIVVNTPVGVGEQQLAEGFSVFANEATTRLTLRIDEQLLENELNLSVVVYNIAGEEVARIQNLENASQELSIEHLEPGLYFCSLLRRDAIITSKKIIRR